jgi:hypothetical protein
VVEFTLGNFQSDEASSAIALGNFESDVKLTSSIYSLGVFEPDEDELSSASALGNLGFDEVSSALVTATSSDWIISTSGISDEVSSAALTFVAASTCNVVSLAWFKLAVSLPAITAAVAASSQSLSLK